MALSDYRQDPRILSGVSTPLDWSHKYRWARELDALSSPEGITQSLQREPDYSLDEYLDSSRYKVDPYQRNRMLAKAEQAKHASPSLANILAKSAIITLSSLAGFAVGGFAGAAIAGSVAGGSVSAIDSRLRKGKVDWHETLLNGFVGSIPGVWGTGGKVAGKWLAQAAPLRTVVQGALDGSLVAGMAMVGNEALSQWRNGEFRPGRIAGTLLKAVLGGAAVGAAAGSGMVLGSAAVKQGPSVQAWLRHQATKKP